MFRLQRLGIIYLVSRFKPYLVYFHITNQRLGCLNLYLILYIVTENYHILKDVNTKSYILYNCILVVVCSDDLRVKTFMHEKNGQPYPYQKKKLIHHYTKIAFIDPIN